MKKKWYAVKTFYASKKKKNLAGVLFEERIVLFRASSLDQAIKLGEEEAENYSSSWKSQKGAIVELNYTGYCDAFELYKAPGESREVFSSTSYYAEPKITTEYICNQRLGPDLTESRRVKMHEEFF